MKPNHFLLCLLACLPALMISCEKNDSPATDVARPWNGLGEKVTTSVSGYITNENDEPLFGAQITIGDQVMTTDEFGYFSVTNVSLYANSAVIKTEKGGYLQNFRTLTPGKEKETLVHIKMLIATEAGTIPAAEGGIVTTTEGAAIELPANGVVLANGGGAYTGKVHVKARRLSNTRNEENSALLPGDMRGVDQKQHYKIVRPFVTIAVELYGDNSERLQIAATKLAKLIVPIPEEDAAAAPAAISLWYLDESTGLWSEQGEATKQGNNYVASVSHFSYWSAAIGYPLVNFTARVTNAAGQALSHVPVMVTIAGQPLNAGYGQFDFTDANGDVSGALPANTALVLDVLTTCHTSAYSHNFSTTNADMDLGTLTGNLGQNMVTISGTAVNCSNAAIASGYVQTYDHGFYNRIPIVNGSFSFTGLSCTNTTVNYVTVDNATNLQSAPQSISLVAGANNLGALSSCGQSKFSSMSFTIDGVTKTLAEPADTMISIFADVTTGWTTVIVLGSNVNISPDMSFQLEGPAALGNNHTVTDIFSNVFPDNRGYAPVPLKVTITEFGNIGGFISGSFGGLVLGFNDNSIHDFSCSFRVRRMQ